MLQSIHAAIKAVHTLLLSIQMMISGLPSLITAAVKEANAGGDPKAHAKLDALAANVAEIKAALNAEPVTSAGALPAFLNPGTVRIGSVTSSGTGTLQNGSGDQEGAVTAADPASAEQDGAAAAQEGQQADPLPPGQQAA